MTGRPPLPWWAGCNGNLPACSFRRSLAQRDQVFPVKPGDRTFDVSLKDVAYDSPKGDFPHPNTMTCKLMAGDTVLLEQEYYSVVVGFIEWKAWSRPRRVSRSTRTRR